MSNAWNDPAPQSGGRKSEPGQPAPTLGPQTGQPVPGQSTTNPGMTWQQPYPAPTPWPSPTGSPPPWLTAPREPSPLIRRILLVVYLIIGLTAATFSLDVFITSASLGRRYNRIPRVRLLEDPQFVAQSKTLGALLLIALALSLLALGLFLFIVLYYHYRARNLCWYLFPLAGGLIFAGLALFSRQQPRDYRMPAKLWNVLALLGLFGLDQTTGSFIYLVPPATAGQAWAITVYLVLLTGTLTYFIWWGRRHGLVQWSFRNIWHNKGKILLTLLAAFVLIIGFSWLMHQLGSPVTSGSNQDVINLYKRHVPAIVMWLGGAIGAPIMEETIFRVGIFELLLPQHRRLALVTSIAIFAFLHVMANPWIWQLWVIYGCLGAALGLLYYKTRKVEVNTCLHFLWNGVITYLPF